MQGDVEEDVLDIFKGDMRVFVGDGLEECKGATSLAVK